MEGVEEEEEEFWDARNEAGDEEANGFALKDVFDAGGGMAN